MGELPEFIHQMEFVFDFLVLLVFFGSCASKMHVLVMVSSLNPELRYIPRSKLFSDPWIPLYLSTSGSRSSCLVVPWLAL
jgi:hypothetical protein